MGIREVVQYFLPATPVFLLWLVTLCICVVRSRTDAKSSLLIAGAVGLGMFNYVFLFVAYYLVLPRLQQDIDGLQIAYMAMRFISALISTVSWGLMLYAVFRRDRDPIAWEISTSED